MNCATESKGYLSPHKRRVLNELYGSLLLMIHHSTVEPDVRADAQAVLDYYLYNPFTSQLPGFFHPSLAKVHYGLPVHENSADHQYVPLLVTLLLSNHDFLQMRLEQLEMCHSLDGFCDSTRETAETLCNRFVTGLARYAEIDHSNYTELMNTLPRYAFGDLPTPTSEPTA